MRLLNAGYWIVLRVEKIPVPIIMSTTKSVSVLQRRGEILLTDVEKDDSEPSHMIPKRRLGLDRSTNSLLVGRLGAVTSLDTRVCETTIVNDRGLRVAGFGVG